MANKFEQIPNPIQAGQIIRAGHVSQSLVAFTGLDAYDINLSGSFAMTGSIYHIGIDDAAGAAASVLVRDNATGEYHITGSYGGGGGGSGTSGTSGSSGSSGTSGINGADGTSGSSGSSGTSGIGADGTSGSSGSSGTSGVGIDGTSGSSGSSGTSGIGADGTSGSSGSSGTSGIGADGTSGSSGSSGTSGTSGSSGSSGVGGVTTAGLNVTITGTGTIADPYIVAANSAASGSSGTSGSSGSSGTSGSSGETGTSGSSGSSGTSGSSGEAGTSGSSGSSGTSGSSGSSGTSGSSGNSGTSGSSGSSGTSGSSGNSGTSGSSGSSGTSGSSGAAGTSGSSGSSGTSGSSGAGSAVQILDENISLTTDVASIDFVGAGVIATNLGNAVTVTIAGGGGSSVNTFNTMSVGGVNLIADSLADTLNIVNGTLISSSASPSTDTFNYNVLPPAQIVTRKGGELGVQSVVNGTNAIISWTTTQGYQNNDNWFEINNDGSLVYDSIGGQYIQIQAEGLYEFSYGIWTQGSQNTAYSLFNWLLYPNSTLTGTPTATMYVSTETNQLGNSSGIISTSPKSGNFYYYVSAATVASGAYAALRLYANAGDTAVGAASNFNNTWWSVKRIYAENHII